MFEIMIWIVFFSPIVVQQNELASKSYVCVLFLDLQVHDFIFFLILFAGAIRYWIYVDVKFFGRSWFPN